MSSVVGASGTVSGAADSARVRRGSIALSSRFSASLFYCPRQVNVLQDKALTRRSDDLTRRSDDLTRQSDDLTRRSDGLTRRSDGLTCRSDGLTRWSDGLTRWSDSLTRRSDDLTRRLGDLTGGLRCETHGARTCSAGQIAGGGPGRGGATSPGPVHQLSKNPRGELHARGRTVR